MKISVPLSRAGVRRAIEQVEAYDREIDPRVDEFCRRMVEEGAATAFVTVPVGTGDLRDGISVERRGDASYLLVSVGDHAAFVEFGTGVVGQGTYGGDLPESWGYDERRTPEAHDPNDPTVWHWFDEGSGTFRSTRGRPAAGYMLAASQQMCESALRIAREVWS